MNTKHYILASVSVAALIGLIGGLVTLHAEEPNEEAPMSKPRLFQSMPNATIHQDSAITQLMEDHWAGRVRGEVEIQGWRLQIYSSNNQLQAKKEAEQLKDSLQNEITEPIYVEFSQPFWKVRVGNFQTAEEAKAYKTVLLEQFPFLQSEAYPVRDMIKVKQ